jgi:hypothetical protein
MCYCTIAALGGFLELLEETAVQVRKQGRIEGL